MVWRHEWERVVGVSKPVSNKGVEKKMSSVCCSVCGKPLINSITKKVINHPAIIVALQMNKAQVVHDECMEGKTK